LRLRIIAVGSKMPSWIEAGFSEYHKRMPPELRVEVVEIPLGQRGKNQDLTRALTREGQAMLRTIGDDRVIALEVTGKSWSTEQLASNLHGWQLDGRNVSMLIGGPDGLARECLARAECRWSLSNLTLPHPLARVVLMEQLYRAWSINAGHPYHRA